MSTPRASNFVAAALAVACVVVGSAILAELLSPPFAASDAGNVERSRGADTGERLDWSMPALSQFTVVLERPLFTPDRRPLQAQKQSAATITHVRPNVVLEAVVAAPDRKLALIEGKSGTVLLSEGDDIEGWRLAEIHAEHVILRAAAASHRIDLKDIPSAGVGSGTIGSGPSGVMAGAAATTSRYFFPVIPYHQPPLATGPEIEPPADDAPTYDVEQGR